jgi:hypothetical protein
MAKLKLRKVLKAKGAELGRCGRLREAHMLRCIRVAGLSPSAGSDG